MIEKLNALAKPHVGGKYFSGFELKNMDAYVGLLCSPGEPERTVYVFITGMEIHKNPGDEQVSELLGSRFKAAISSLKQ